MGKNTIKIKFKKIKASSKSRMAGPQLNHACLTLAPELPMDYSSKAIGPHNGKMKNITVENMCPSFQAYLAL